MRGWKSVFMYVFWQPGQLCFLFELVGTVLVAWTGISKEGNRLPLTAETNPLMLHHHDCLGAVLYL